MSALIVAMDQNGLIGLDDMLPWHLPSELAYFKQATQNKTVLMGGKTYQSLKNYFKNEVLPGRDKVVITTQKQKYADEINVFASLWDPKLISNDTMIIGGSLIYKLALPYVDLLMITEVQTKIEIGDQTAYYFKIPEGWIKESSLNNLQSDNDNYNYNITRWVRKHATVPAVFQEEQSDSTDESDRGIV